MKVISRIATASFGSFEYAYAYLQCWPAETSIAYRYLHKSGVFWGPLVLQSTLDAAVPTISVILTEETVMITFVPETNKQRKIDLERLCSKGGFRRK